MPRQHRFTFKTRSANRRELALAMSHGTETRELVKSTIVRFLKRLLEKNAPAKRISRNQNHATPFGVSATGVVSPYSLYSPFFLFSPIPVIV